MLFFPPFFLDRLIITVCLFFGKWQTMVAFQLACSRGSILSESPEPSVLDKYFSE